MKIDLIVRGVCALRPGVPGSSENIRVRSIVGRFLEHTRVFYFRNGGDEEVYLSSADWMDRNFFRRIELASRCSTRSSQRRVIHEGLKPYLDDNTQAWEMHPDGSFARRKRGRGKKRCAQAELLASLAGYVVSARTGSRGTYPFWRPVPLYQSFHQLRAVPVFLRHRVGGVVLREDLLRVVAQLRHPHPVVALDQDVRAPRGACGEWGSAR